MSALEKNVFVTAERIASWKRPLLITHAKPDGDALGALVAMRAWLQARGVNPVALLFDPIPSRYAAFHRYEAIPVWSAGADERDLADVDAVIALDTCSYNQLDPIADWIRSCNLPKLVVDHHVTRDDLADLYIIDESAAATCLILYDMALALDWPMDVATCEALYVGIATDTGWFRYSNTDHRVLAAAADLASRGADPHELYRQLYQRETPARVRLLGAALNTLELLAGDRLAVMSLTSQAMTDCGAASADTEDIVNEPLRISSVIVSVLLVESGDGLIRTSFRSKRPPDAAPTHAPASPAHQRDVDVSMIARAFGGGGHVRAAAARIKGTLPEVRSRVVNHIQKTLASASETCGQNHVK